MLTMLRACWAQVVGALALVGLGVLVLRPFVVPTAWAAILAFATWPAFRRLERALAGRTGGAGGGAGRATRRRAPMFTPCPAVISTTSRHLKPSHPGLRNVRVCRITAS